VTKFLLGMAVGYMFHDAIDKVIANASTTVEKAADKASDKADEKMEEATS